MAWTSSDGRYGDDALECLAFIRTAQRRGLSLDEIREILALRDGGERPCAYVRDVLRRQVVEIDERMAELARLRDELVALDSLADRLPETGAGCGIIDHARAAADTAT
jgi:DNA-binding transcriptional MerR regulator